jgi:hypothetical protein
MKVAPIVTHHSVDNGTESSFALLSTVLCRLFHNLIQFKSTSTFAKLFFGSRSSFISGTAEFVTFDGMCFLVRAYQRRVESAGNSLVSRKYQTTSEHNFAHKNLIKTPRTLSVPLFWFVETFLAASETAFARPVNSAS